MVCTYWRYLVYVQERALVIYFPTSSIFFHLFFSCSMFEGREVK